MEVLRSWVLGITLCAGVGTVLFVLVPRGSMERSMRSVLALFMIYAVAAPLLKLKTPRLDADRIEGSYSQSAAQYAEVVEKRMLDAADDAVRREILRAVPRLDNASTLIEVRSALNGENSVYIESVTVYLNGSGIAASQVKKELREKLGLTAEVIE